MRKQIYRILAVVIALVAGGMIYLGMHPALYIGTLAQYHATKLADAKHIVSENKKDKAAKYNGNLAVNSLSQLEQLAKGKDKLTLRGFVSIPKIGVKLPIYEGASDKVLALGAGTLKAGQHMGKANYAIGAHNMADNRTYFSPLQTKLKLGMHVDLVNRDKRYTYEIVQKQVISQNTVGVITDHDSGVATITLITCYEEPPYFTGATKRVYAFGKLITTTLI
ncbi:class A sortase [Periweissella cryptocerci]|uniref:Class A sortase n=1 Tax=Periweissella cryptocerci TaxID=2506420 RepID=A0A4P6YR93_9LACO|nr:class A sortase [Periweissella cryptocerci]QBO35126.1 class A sortase [Periweissella cryptocerci]